jgi:hypothetical protein
MAWEIMPQRGKTRAKTRRMRLERDAAEFIGKQYKQTRRETAWTEGIVARLAGLEGAS